MMIKFRYLLLFLACLAFACTKHPQTEEFLIPSVRISTSLQAVSTVTRVNSAGAGDVFEPGDALVVSDGQTTARYELQGNTEWSSSSPLLWNHTTMHFHAWYPATEQTTASSFTLPTDQSTPEHLSQGDYMLSPPVEISHGNSVPLRLRRQNTRFILQIKFEAGLTGNETEIASIRIFSPFSGYEQSLPAGSPQAILPYHSPDSDAYYALLIPTSTPQPRQTFVEMRTLSGRVYTLGGIPACQAGKSYTYRLTARGDSDSRLAIESVDVGDWIEQQIPGGYERRFLVTQNGIGTYHAVGEQVSVKADWIAQKKFSEWTSDSPSVVFASAQAPSTTFLMPEEAVVITAKYSEAPYRLTIGKPGVIVNARGEDTTDPILTQEYEREFVRYYAAGDEVCLYTSTSASFSDWRKSESTPSEIYTVMANEGGHYTSSATWFRMPAYDVELAPRYKASSEPFWVSQSTNKGWLEANFIERLNTAPGSLTIPGGGVFYRALTDDEKAAVMRALQAVEQTFSDPPSRRISINFAVFNAPASGVGAATSPVAAAASVGHPSPKAFWTADDFGGRAVGLKAHSSTIEAVWRDGIPLLAYGPSATSIGFRDGTIMLNHSHVSAWYKGEDPHAIPMGYIDLETVILHELGHLICYHSLNMRVDQLTALDAFVSHVSDPDRINVRNGNMFSTDGGQAILYDDFVKSYLGRYPEVSCQSENKFDFGHLDMGPGLGVGAMYRAGGTTCRRFEDFELALLRQMGWRVNPAAWSRPPVAIPSPIRKPHSL